MGCVLIVHIQSACGHASVRYSYFDQCRHYVIVNYVV